MPQKHSYRLKALQFKQNRNDRSWKHRSCRGWHFGHGLKEGHGDQRAARTSGKEADTRGIGRPSEAERALPRIN